LAACGFSQRPPTRRPGRACSTANLTREDLTREPAAALRPRRALRNTDGDSASALTTGRAASTAGPAGGGDEGAGVCAGSGGAGGAGAGGTKQSSSAASDPPGATSIATATQFRWSGRAAAAGEIARTVVAPVPAGMVTGTESWSHAAPLLPSRQSRTLGLPLIEISSEASSEAPPATTHSCAVRAKALVP
jgi:hypothetical protein